MTDLLAENKQLRSEIEYLRTEVALLTERLALLDTHKTLAKGMRGESLVASWVNGVVTTHNASHDIELAGTLIKLEIKYSGLGFARRGIQAAGRETQRWAWSKPFGESGNKVYDRLILVGDKDPRHVGSYKDRECPYVLFDVPFDEIMPLTIQTNAGRYRSIQLTTNPKTARSADSLLFRKYQVTLGDLSERYGL